MEKAYSFSQCLKYLVILAASTLFLFLQSCWKGDAVGPVVPQHPLTIPVVTVVPNTANFDKLTAWNAYKINQGSRYDLDVIGDSYVQGDYFTPQLRGKLLADGYDDGGPGYCSFGREDPTNTYSLDNSIDGDLFCTYNLPNWNFVTDNAYGPCGNITNIAANSAINVFSSVALVSFTIVYERHASAGNFQYRVNSGSWVTVNMANPTQDIGNTVVDVSGAGSIIELDIMPLAAGETFCGVVSRRAGNVLNIHKAGSAGTDASFFAQNALWSESTSLLTPTGVIIVLGTNDLERNITPTAMEVDMQKIINAVKKTQPNADVMIVCPPETKYENEDPRKYKIADYGATLYQLALTNKAAFVYLPGIFGHFSQALVDQGIMDADRIHPGGKGGQLIASTIYSAFKK